MADAGIEDILITYNIVGRHKLARLVALARRARLTLGFDSREVAEGVSSALSGANLSVGAMVECDTGAGRCGAQSPSEAAELAAAISRLPGLEFRGPMSDAPEARPQRPRRGWRRRSPGASARDCPWRSSVPAARPISTAPARWRRRPSIARARTSTAIATWWP